MPHAEGKAEQQGKPQTHHNGVQYGAEKIHPVVSGAVDQGVGRSPERGAVEKEHADRNIGQADGDDIGIVGEDGEKLLREKHEDRGQSGADGKGQKQHRADDLRHAFVVVGLRHAFVVVGTQVLADHGGTGGVEGAAEHIGDDGDLVGDAREGGDRHAVGIDKGIDEELAHLHGHGFKGHGDTELEKLFQQDGVGLEKVRQGEGDPEQVSAADDQHGAADKAESLADHGGEGSAAGTHPETHDEQQIQEHIADGGDPDEQEGMTGVPETAQNGAGGVVAEDEHKAAQADGHIVIGLRPCLGGGVHDPEERHAEEEEQQTQRQRAEEQERKQHRHEAADALALPRAEILGDDDLTGVGKAHGDKGEEIHQIPAHGYGGQADLSHHMAHDDHVHHVVHRLEKTGQEERRREAEQGRGDRPRGEIGHEAFLFRQVHPSFLFRIPVSF